MPPYSKNCFWLFKYDSISWITDFFAPVCSIAARIAAWGTESNALEASHATIATTSFLDDSFWITRSLMLFMASVVDRPGIPPKRF